MRTILQIFIILSFISFFFTSCSRRKTIMDTIIEMSNKTVNLELDSMTRIDPSNRYHNITDAILTLVVFADSNQCSNCYLNKLKQWDKMIKMESITDGKIAFQFIIDSKEENIESLINNAQNLEFEHPIYFDKNHLFYKSNQFFPHQSMYHTFLLDKNQKIILVGNPLLNNDIKKIMLKIIKKDIGNIDSILECEK